MDNREHALENAIIALKEGKTKEQWVEENKDTNLPYFEMTNAANVVWTLAETMKLACDYCKNGDKTLSEFANTINYQRFAPFNSYANDQTVFAYALRAHKLDKIAIAGTSQLGSYLDKLCEIDSTKFKPIISDLVACINYAAYTYCENCEHCARKQYCDRKRSANAEDHHEKYYVLDDIFDWLGFDYKFKEKKSDYPFNRKKENLRFSWGQITIPKAGIRETVMSRIKGESKPAIKELNMLYQIPYIDMTRKEPKAGVINQDISLSFRYDKEYKYGEVTKSIYEVCMYILDHAEFTNDYYIISGTEVFDFMSHYVINNQWGIGRTLNVSNPDQLYGDDKKERAKDPDNYIEHIGTEEQAVSVSSEDEDVLMKQDIPAKELNGTYAIYQLKTDEYTTSLMDDVRLAAVDRHGVTITCDRYDKVYEGNLEEFEGNLCGLLETMFDRFNNELPEGYTGRSMSVSDVIVITNYGETYVYYCDNIGFTQILGFFNNKEEI